MSDISPNVVILTRQELSEIEAKAFQRGVARGKFEAGSTSQRVARNCANWAGGRCETCGVQWQYFDVNGDFACPHFKVRLPAPPAPQGDGETPYLASEGTDR
jgi:hypothetical protein